MIRRWLGRGWLCVVILLSGCNEASLLQDLDQTQANEVMAVLQRHNIEATKLSNKGGFSVQVDQPDFATAVDILKAYGLPAAKAVQVADMFPSDSLVASPRAEKARMVSAIEQRLEQSLRTISGVVSARVHISYDLEAMEGRKGNPVHVSALASHDGSILAPALINDIKRLLRNSIAELDYERISVVLVRQSMLQHEAPREARRQNPDTVVLWIAAGGVLAVLLAVSLTYWLVRREQMIGPHRGNDPRRNGARAGDGAESRTGNARAPVASATAHGMVAEAPQRS